MQLVRGWLVSTPCVIFDYQFLNNAHITHCGCHMIYNHLFQLYDSLCQVCLSWNSFFVWYRNLLSFDHKYLLIWPKWTHKALIILGKTYNTLFERGFYLTLKPRTNPLCIEFSWLHSTILFPEIYLLKKKKTKGETSSTASYAERSTDFCTWESDLIFDFMKISPSAKIVTDFICNTQLLHFSKRNGLFQN